MIILRAGIILGTTLSGGTAGILIGNRFVEYYGWSPYHVVPLSLFATGVTVGFVLGLWVRPPGVLWRAAVPLIVLLLPMSVGYGTLLLSVPLLGGSYSTVEVSISIAFLAVLLVLVVAGVSLVIGDLLGWWILVLAAGLLTVLSGLSSFAFPATSFPQFAMGPLLLAGCAAWAGYIENQAQRASK